MNVYRFRPGLRICAEWFVCCAVGGYRVVCCCAADLLAMRLETERNGEMSGYAGLCYVCSGNLSRLVEHWSRNAENCSAPLALQVCSHLCCWSLLICLVSLSPVDSLWSDTVILNQCCLLSIGVDLIFDWCSVMMVAIIYFFFVLLMFAECVLFFRREKLHIYIRFWLQINHICLT